MGLFCVRSLHQGDKVMSGRPASWQVRDADPCEEAEIVFGQCIGYRFKITRQLQGLFEQCRLGGEMTTITGVPSKNHRGHLRLQVQTNVRRRQLNALHGDTKLNPVR